VNELELYKYALKHANESVSESEGVDLCHYIDNVKTKAIVRQLLDNIYNDTKQREKGHNLTSS
jgi:hypothetical protein